MFFNCFSKYEFLIDANEIFKTFHFQIIWNKVPKLISTVHQHDILKNICTFTTFSSCIYTGKKTILILVISIYTRILENITRPKIRKVSRWLTAWFPVLSWHLYIFHWCSCISWSMKWNDFLLILKYSITTCFENVRKVTKKRRLFNFLVILFIFSVTKAWQTTCIAARS